MENRTDSLSKIIYKFLRIIWGIQWIFLTLTIAYSLLDLKYDTFFSLNYILAIREVPFHLNEPGWIEFEDGSRQEFIITSAQGTMRFPNYDSGALRLVTIREILLQSAGLAIVFLVLHICKSLLDKQPFTIVNANRLKYIGLITLATTILNTFFIFHLGKYLSGKIDAANISANVNTHLNYTALLFGLLLLIISQVFKIGVRIQEEQRLFI